MECQRDGGSDQLEGVALVGGGFGEDRHGGVGPGEAGLVAGQGGQVGQESAEAAAAEVPDEVPASTQISTWARTRSSSRW